MYKNKKIAPSLTNDLFDRLSDMIILHISSLDIKLLKPVAQQTSRFEKLLAPYNSYWPRYFLEYKTECVQCVAAVLCM